MEKMNQWETRRQVPESDPVYQAERIKSKNMVSYGRIAFEGGAYDYEWKVETSERLGREVEQFRADLEKTEDQSSRANILKKIEGNSDIIEEYTKEKGKRLRESFDRLFHDITIAFIGIEEGDWHRFVIEQIKKMFDGLEDGNRFDDYFPNGLSSDSAKNFLFKIIDGSIYDETLLALAKKHLEDIHEQEKQLSVIFEETRSEFENKIKDAVSKGELPEEALHALGRLDSVVINISDRLTSINSRTLGTMGHDGSMTASNEQLQTGLIPGLKKTICHELFHEISGKSVTVRSKTIENGNLIRSTFYRKSGVRLFSPDQVHTPNVWLNEAITEWLALRISGYREDNTNYAYKGSVSYVDERKELDRLFEAGLEESVVTEAYFENFSSNQPKETRGPKFARLVQRINELEGPLGFGRIENTHILNNIWTQLDEWGMHPSSSFIDNYTPPEEVRIFDISVSVGANPKVEVTKNFVFLSYPIKIGDNTITVEEQFKKREEIIESIKRSYPHVKISVRERGSQI